MTVEWPKPGTAVCCVPPIDGATGGGPCQPAVIARIGDGTPGNLNDDLNTPDGRPLAQQVMRYESGPGYWGSDDFSSYCGRTWHLNCHAGEPAVNRPEPEPEPDQYRGVIIIEWPAAHGASPYSVIVGRKTEITDALTGKPIRTCTGFTVRMDVEALVTADLTLLAGEHGEPLLEGRPVMKDGEILTATFPFLVAEMRVQS